MLQIAKKPLTVQLDPDMVARIDAMVSAGLYANASEVVGEALDLWQAAINQREFETEMRKAYEAGMMSRGSAKPDAATFLRRLGDRA